MFKNKIIPKYKKIKVKKRKTKFHIQMQYSFIIKTEKLISSFFLY
jgi:hypothetical protein